MKTACSIKIKFLSEDLFIFSCFYLYVSALKLNYLFICLNKGLYLPNYSSASLLLSGDFLSEPNSNFLQTVF
jgi:hypothetical protein